MKTKANLDSMRAGIPQRSSDTNMNRKSEEYNRARRDVMFTKDKEKVAEDKAEVYKEKFLVEQSRSALQSTLGDIKVALAAMVAGQTAKNTPPPLPGGAVPVGAAPPLPINQMGPATGPTDMPPEGVPMGGPLPTNGAPPGMDPSMQGPPPGMM